MTTKKKIKTIQLLYKNQIRNKEGFLKVAGMNFFVKEDTVRTYWMSLGNIPDAKLDLMLKLAIEYVKSENKESDKLIKKLK